MTFDLDISYDFHFCEPKMRHELHWRVGVGRTPGWYVFKRAGCRLSTSGPYATEHEARATTST